METFDSIIRFGATAVNSCQCNLEAQIIEHEDDEEYASPDIAPKANVGTSHAVHILAPPRSEAVSAHQFLQGVPLTRVTHGQGAPNADVDISPWQVDARTQPRGVRPQSADTAGTAGTSRGPLGFAVAAAAAGQRMLRKLGSAEDEDGAGELPKGLDGRWVHKDSPEIVEVIKGDTIHGPNGTCSQMMGCDKDSISIDLDGTRYFATRAGDELFWSDGDIWVRCPDPSLPSPLPMPPREGAKRAEKKRDLSPMPVVTVVPKEMSEATEQRTLLAPELPSEVLPSPAASPSASPSPSPAKTVSVVDLAASPSASPLPSLAASPAASPAASLAASPAASSLAAGAAALAAGASQEPRAERKSPTCPAGHSLQVESVPYPGKCDRCFSHVRSGELASRCAICKWDLCTRCHLPGQDSAPSPSLSGASASPATSQSGPLSGLRNLPFFQRWATSPELGGSPLPGDGAEVSLPVVPPLPGESAPSRLADAAGSGDGGRVVPGPAASEASDACPSRARSVSPAPSALRSAGVMAEPALPEEAPDVSPLTADRVAQMVLEEAPDSLGVMAARLAADRVAQMVPEEPSAEENLTGGDDALLGSPGSEDSKYPKLHHICDFVQ